jgi:hypothetical protein
MTPRRIHREKMLRDDIFWLETRIQQLQTARGDRDRRLADCYRKLLRQRQVQLDSRVGAGGNCGDCWQEYFA